MPLTHLVSTRLGKKLTDVRKDGSLWWLRPDGMTQVTIEYVQHSDGSVEPKKLHTVVISTQHAEPLKAITLKNGQPATSIYDRNTCNLHINPSGKFIIGGPQGDAGLTGRKIIIDTYGGWGAHGGG